MAGDRTLGVPAAGIAAATFSAPASTLTAEPSAFLWNVPMGVLCILVLSSFGRPFEFFLTGYKIPFVICVLAGVVVLTTRGLTTLNSAPGLPLVALVGWMLAATPFSTWRGGSAMYVLYFVALQVILFMLAASAPRSLADIRKIAYFTVGGYFLYSLLASVDRGVARFDLKGTFGNADDVALFAGFVLPLLVLAALQLRNVFLKITLLGVGGGLLLRAVGMTGTRAAIPALLGMLLVYFLRGNGVQRLMLVALTVTGGLVMIAILPNAILTRFATITKSFNTETIMEESGGDEAMASVAERRELVLDAIRMTIAHPVFGVGPGEYPDYRAQFLDTHSGGHKRFFPSHNTYLQVSSEEGIPGLLCYLAFLGGIYWTIRRSMRLNQPGSHPDWVVGRRIGVALEAALVYFAICAAFMTCERHPHQYVLAGMALALYRISMFRVSQTQQLSKQAVKIPAAPRIPTPVPADQIRALPSAALAGGGAVPTAAAARPHSALRRPR
jgi:O-antigen ligase